MGKRNIIPARFLSKSDMQKIHEQALLLLETMGIEIDDDTALKMLADSGAKVDFQTKIVKFHADLVEKSLKTLPRELTLAGRNPKRDLLLTPGGKVHTRNTGGMAHIRDLNTGEIREATIKDVGDFARLIDALDNISFIAPLYAEDVAPATREIRVLEAMIKNTDKHVNIRALAKENLPHLIQMGVALAGGKEQLKKRPVISVLEAPIAPFKFPDVFIEALFLCGEYGVPIEFVPCRILERQVPMTLAGSLLLATVEHLATFVVSQVANPGAPVIWAPRFPLMDMATGQTGLLADGIIVSGCCGSISN